MRAIAAGPPRWLEWLRRHERALALGYLAVTVLVLAALAAPPVRVPVLGLLQGAVDRWEARWSRRLAAGERLLAAGHAGAATAYLERLDRIFPARTSRHARDQERERLLVLLARAYEAAGRTRLTMETYQRLVAFDTLNYFNRYELARAAERLLSGWAVAPEARDGYAAALRLFPSHLPSLRGYVDYYMDRGDFAPVVQAYRVYLDAALVERIEVRLGGATVAVRVMADGRPHHLVVPAPVPGARVDTVELRSAFPLAVEHIEVVGAARVGRPGPGTGASARLDTGPILPSSDSASVAVRLPALAAGLGELRLRVRVFKPVDAGLWALVVRSHRNLLDGEGLAAATARTAPMPTAEAADRILRRTGWARSGLGDRVDER